MIWAAGAGALLCLIYYGVIVCYSGFSTSFSWFWPGMAVFLLALAAGGIYSRLHPRRCPLWVPVSALTFLGASTVILCVVEVLVFLGAVSPDAPNLDYVIVLGAKVENGRISSSLEKRLQKAIEYIEKNPETILILSGGQGSDEPASEASVMYEYLKYNGVPQEQMIMEDRSGNTWENISFSKEVIDRLEREKDKDYGQISQKAPGPYLEVEDKPLQVGVLTSGFHVYRATQIAGKAGIREVYGISARSDGILLVHLCVRECAAILKDKLMGNM